MLETMEIPETLAKTPFAPMFAYRNLGIVGWMSYNILGDYDGKVLAAKDNKESKPSAKIESSKNAWLRTLQYNRDRVLPESR